MYYSTSVEQGIICVAYNTLTKISKTLTTDGADIDYYVEGNSRGQVRCAFTNTSTELLSFHLFVDNGDQFFTEMGVADRGEDGVWVACLGSYFTTDVKLLVNGHYSDAVYDPLQGFRLKEGNRTANKLYQCEKDSERRSATFIEDNRVFDAFGNKFRMTMETYMLKTEVRCIVETDPELPNENYTFILVCPNRSICPNLSSPRRTENKLIASAYYPNSLVGTAWIPHCAFLKNDKVIAQVFMKKPEDLTNLIIVVLLIVLSVIIILAIVKTCDNFRYKRLSSIITFKKGQISLEEGRKIGEGNSSIIYLVPMKDDKREVVVKCLKNLSKTSLFYRELKILESLNRYTVVSPIGVTKLPVQKWCYKLQVEHLVLPYYPEKSLEVFMKKYSPAMPVEENNVFIAENGYETVTITELIGFGWQIADALAYLKLQKITHRDVAMRNVLVSANRLLKLSDFERAQRGETTKVSITSKWMIACGKVKIPWQIYPMEALNGLYYYSSEVYSFGNLLLSLFQFGNSQFFTHESYCLFLKNGPTRPPYCPQRIYENIIIPCMELDCTNRPDILACAASLETILNIEYGNVIEVREAF
ncbi:unnamed protein product [Caenorhabditis sp. 36 PRJEB53466]|nr:unnamed protein product [Caenorhabditis sp. 36 PRJEB53466]